MDRKCLTIKMGRKEVTFETGRIARQAGGAVFVQCDETILLATACAAKERDESADFLPLKVDYQEKFSSAGKTLGGFIKREGRPTQKEILVSRLIDRPLRPIFEEGYHNEVQVLTYVMSFDGENSPEPLAICAASCALVISEIPLIKPVAAVRVGMINGEFIINPTIKEQEISVLDLLIAGSEDAVLMIEGYCDFLTEEQVMDAITTGHSEIAKICQAFAKWGKEVGKAKERSTIHIPHPDAAKAVQDIAEKDLVAAVAIKEKQLREEAIAAIDEKVRKELFPDGGEAVYTKLDISKAFKALQSKIMRNAILDKGIRSDGRGVRDIRPISIEQSLLSRAHGSTLFTRGETQAIAVCTLGGESMGQRYEDLLGEGTQSFYLQYSFPPFSVGEVGRMGSPGRREVGHGKLAERAIQAALPSKESFPYTIRLESNITESNGSSSMASVCGGCLALMDAGVPIKRPVSGIAMGLILEQDRYTILSDILGLEDALGDMDFKVTGDDKGITAFQMDIKVEGITPAIMKAALAQAKEGRIHILEKMLEVQPASRTVMSKHAPRIVTIQVKQSKIGMIIGPGGKQIRAIVDETGVEVDINDDGLVSLTSSSAEGMERAKQIIEGIVAEIEVGKTYHGRVVSVVDFGAFVEVLPGKEGLCHISEFDNVRINQMSDVVKPGDEITVKVLDIDDRGRVKLSRRATLDKKPA